MRDYKVLKTNEHTKIVVPTSEGQVLHYVYEIVPSDVCESKMMSNPGCASLGIVHFHHGSIKENGVHGCFDEDLIAIVIDRLKGFQSGDFSRPEIASALTKLEEALMWLNKRTQDRVKRELGWQT